MDEKRAELWPNHGDLRKWILKKRDSPCYGDNQCSRKWASLYRSCDNGRFLLSALSLIDLVKVFSVNFHPFLLEMCFKILICTLLSLLLIFVKITLFFILLPFKEIFKKLPIYKDLSALFSTTEVLKGKPSYMCVCLGCAIVQPFFEQLAHSFWWNIDADRFAVANRGAPYPLHHVR